MYQHHVGAYFVQGAPDAGKNGGRYVRQGLIFPHDRQVIIRYHAECREHRIQHLAVLTGDAHGNPDIFPGLQLVDEGTHFDRFRTGAENKHDRFHNASFFNGDFWRRVCAGVR